MPKSDQRKIVMQDSNYIEGDLHGSIQARNVSINQISGSPATLNDIVNLIKEIEAAVEVSSEIDGREKRKLKEDLQSARSSMDDPHPDTKRALSRMESAVEILKYAAAVATSAATLIPLAEKAINWLKAFAIN